MSSRKAIEETFIRCCSTSHCSLPSLQPCRNKISGSSNSILATCRNGLQTPCRASTPSSPLQACSTVARASLMMRFRYKCLEQVRLAGFTFDVLETDCNYLQARKSVVLAVSSSTEEEQSSATQAVIQENQDCRLCHTSMK